MSNFINLLRRKLFTQNNKVMYGRWSLDYEQCIQDRKVYLTNMDHCGCCENAKKKQSNDYKNLYDNDSDYIIPFLL
jgi:hypothetical protein